MGVKATDFGVVFLAMNAMNMKNFINNGQDCSDVWNAYLIKYDNYGDASWH